MSDHAAHSHDHDHDGHDHSHSHDHGGGHGHGGEQPHSHKSLYIKVGALLTFLTFVELVVLPDILAMIGIAALPVMAVNTLLVVLSVAKLLFVVGIFMHLKDDRRIYTLLFVSPAIIAFFMITVLSLMAIAHFNYPKMAYATTNVRSGDVVLPVAWSEADFSKAYQAQAATQYEDGRKVFEAYCSGCHRIDGGGGIGPAFTDDCYIHGGAFKDIESVLMNGVAAKGMPMWGPVLTTDELRNVALYARSLRGKTVPTPKACEGNPAP